MANVWYFIQVSLCVCVFYILYSSFFRRMTFFKVNRIYLLTSILFSFIIPHIELQFVSADYHVSAQDFISNSAAQTLNFTGEGIAVISENSSYSMIPAIYWIGVFLFIARLIYFVFQIFKIRSSAVVSNNDDTQFVHADIGQPFAFLNMIFLPKRDVSSFVIAHEKAHVRSHHWIDLMIVEMASALLWFNPVMMFYRKALKIQHEYEADAYAASGGGVEQYLECILHHLQLESYSGPVHQFYSKTIKKRIHMITRKKTSHKFTLLYALAIPVLAILLTAFSFRSNQATSVEQFLAISQDSDVVIVVDAGHGGNDSGSRDGDKVTEKEFVLTMAKRIQKVGEDNNVKIILTRTEDKAMSLEERVKMTKQNNADIFISLHTNYDQKNASASGIECLVSEKNDRYKDSKDFAEKLIQEFETLEGISVNGSKVAEPYVLSKNTAPAVVLELGNLSNKADYAYLTDEKNQTLISERIVSAIVQYTK